MMRTTIFVFFSYAIADKGCEPIVGLDAVGQDAFEDVADGGSLSLIQSAVEVKTAGTDRGSLSLEGRAVHSTKKSRQAAVEAPELPAGWHSAVDADSGRTYYYDDKNHSQFEIPQDPDWLAGWHSAVDAASGRTYYYDDKNHSQFEIPQAPESLAGWHSAVDAASGRTYYYDDKNHSQFEIPQDPDWLAGWHSAVDAASGRTYYYDDKNHTQFEIPQAHSLLQQSAEKTGEHTSAALSLLASAHSHARAKLSTGQDSKAARRIDMLATSVRSSTFMKEVFEAAYAEVTYRAASP